MAKNTPYNLEAEQSVLACILLDQVVQSEIISILSEEDFLVESHKTIFASMKEINGANKPVDLVTLADLMQKNAKLESIGGISYLTELTKVIPSAANYEQYLSIVRRDGVLRRLIKSSNLIIEDSTKSTDSQKSLSYAEKLIFDISENEEKRGLEKIGQYFDPVLTKFEKLQTDKNFFTGMKTGFTRLDYMTNGFHKGNLIILAARPSVGKTTFAMNIVENVALKSNAVVAVFALEMTKEELAQRMLCSVGNVSMDDALKGKLADKDEKAFSRLWQTKKLLNDAKIFVDESSDVTPQDVLSRCRRLKMKEGKLDMVVVDHIQLMQSAKKNIESRQQEVTDISRNLKMIAKELDVPVVALSQLSRQITSRKDGKPVLSDLRESGAIEQDADLVIFLHKPNSELVGEKDANGNSKRPDQILTDIIIAKNRNGTCGDFQLLFKGQFVKFINIDDRFGAPSEYQRREDRSKNKDGDEDDSSNLEAYSKEDLDSLEQSIPLSDDGEFAPQDEDDPFN